MSKRYAIHFKGPHTDVVRGITYNIERYYSNYQPNYTWSFINDIEKAKLWKSLNGVNKKIKHAKSCGYRDLEMEVITIEVKEMEIIK